jgi:hypothetical protein
VLLAPLGLAGVSGATGATGASGVDGTDRCYWCHGSYWCWYRMVLLVLRVPQALGATGATGPGATVTIGTNAAEVLSIGAVTPGEITADDAAADKIVFWDDSASKLTYLTVGTNLTITVDTTDCLCECGNSSAWVGGPFGAGSGGTEPSNPFLLMGA